MLVTPRTKSVLHYRRTVKRWISEGYEDIGERGGRLWEIYRGGRLGQTIQDARVAPGGMSVFVKIARPPHAPGAGRGEVG